VSGSHKKNIHPTDETSHRRRRLHHPVTHRTWPSTLLITTKHFSGTHLLSPSQTTQATNINKHQQTRPCFDREISLRKEAKVKELAEMETAQAQSVLTYPLSLGEDFSEPIKSLVTTTEQTQPNETIESTPPDVLSESKVEEEPSVSHPITVTSEIFVIVTVRILSLTSAFSLSCPQTSEEAAVSKPLEHEKMLLVQVRRFFSPRPLLATKNLHFYRLWTPRSSRSKHH